MYRRRSTKNVLLIWLGLFTFVEVYSILLAIGSLPQSPFTYWAALILIVCLSGTSGVWLERHLRSVSGANKTDLIAAQAYLLYFLPPFIACVGLFWRPLLIVSILMFCLLLRNAIFRMLRRANKDVPCLS